MRRFVKAIIPSNSVVFKLLSKVYRESFRIWLPKDRSLKLILDSYSASNNNVTFVQIGSNDGVTGDPLHNYIKTNHWRGILVEPVPYLFEKLKKNYAAYNDQLFFENSAISKNEGIQPFYRLKESNDPSLPAWYDQIGSFNKEVILSHKDLPGFDELFVEDKINTLSFEGLLRKYQLNKIDLIHIDTEGYDFEILKLIDFKKVTPDIIIYEYVHLSVTDFRRSIKLLKANGFTLFSHELDIIGINTKFAQRLS